MLSIQVDGPYCHDVRPPKVNWPVRCHYSYTNFELTVGLRLSRWLSLTVSGFPAGTLLFLPVLPLVTGFGLPELVKGDAIGSLGPGMKIVKTE